MNKILQFPYERIRLEVVPFKEQVQGHQAKILQLPVRSEPLLLPIAFALAWMSLWGVGP